jgi:hypothetical protein
MLFLTSLIRLFLCKQAEFLLGHLSCETLTTILGCTSLIQKRSSGAALAQGYGMGERDCARDADCSR